ncbi:hypothetical protein L596_002185 [Steinernema carpocapsae]|uniref:Uncharacterized protein n=1 Tax=Steinernema carpocapsae TaxID=34508 RepID=A0A4U8UPI6_STECR|nr:hypothetical protein L596_002185 [Steinernema carpocapsae]
MYACLPWREELGKFGFHDDDAHNHEKRNCLYLIGMKLITVRGRWQRGEGRAINNFTEVQGEVNGTLDTSS